MIGKHLVKIYYENHLANTLKTKCMMFTLTGGKHQNKQNGKNNARNNFKIERGQHESENEPGLEIIYLTIQTYMLILVAQFYSVLGINH